NGTWGPHSSSAANCEAPAKTSVLIARITDSSSPVCTAARPKAAPNITTNRETGASFLKPAHTEWRLKRCNVASALVMPRALGCNGYEWRLVEGVWRCVWQDYPLGVARLSP